MDDLSYENDEDIEVTDEEIIKRLEEYPQAVEDLRNKLNCEIRIVLSMVDILDGKTRDYEDYQEYALLEKEYLEQQLELVSEIKERLREIFKESR